MKAGLRMMAVVLALVAAGATAFAQPSPRGPRRGEPGVPMMPQRDDPEQLRQFRGPPEMPRHGRMMNMSPEERRQLRRDIHEAGKDLYREPPGRGPRRPPPQQ